MPTPTNLYTPPAKPDMTYWVWEKDTNRECWVPTGYDTLVDAVRHVLKTSNITLIMRSVGWQVVEVPDPLARPF